MFESVRIDPTPTKGQPDTVVFGVFTDRKLDAAAKSFDKDGSIAAAAKRAECTGEVGKMAEAYPTFKGAPARVIIVGLGARDAFKPAALRNAAAAVGRRLAATKDERIALELAPQLATARRADLGNFGRCFGEGLGLIAWNYTRLKGKGASATNGNAASSSGGTNGSGGGDKPKRTNLRLRAGNAAFASGLSRGLALAESTNFCRDLSETPPNIATPAYMADQARAMAKKAGLSITVIKGDDLEKQQLVGLINVGKASENKPCLIRLEWNPPGKGGAKSKDKPIVLVGKTMTYDSGGLSIKPTPGMAGMKRDKDGGCAVLGAMHAVGTVIKPAKRVVALLVVAENSISDEAYRPDDVITYRNGVTVEVTNTDAEGRLVLADALIWACERENPAAIVDLATLTGGVVTALGSTFAGMFCDDEALLRRLERAMDRSGERWWRLPHDQEYRDMMKSNVADIINSNPNRKAHPIQGAAFLSFFVDKNVPWAHLDIAGVHAVEGDSGPFVKGPTGWGVRLLADYLAG